MSTSRNIKALITQLSKSKKQEKSLLKFAEKLNGNDEEKIRLIREEVKNAEES